MTASYEYYFDATCWQIFKQAMADASDRRSEHLLEEAAASMGRAVLLAVMKSPEWAQAANMRFDACDETHRLSLQFLNSLPQLMEVS